MLKAGRDRPLKTDLDRLRLLHAQMFRIRRFEDRVTELRESGQVLGSVHLCSGQEAIAVGACGVREKQDAVFATYRGHGWALACGAPPVLVFAELLCREDGLNGGRGGSAYLSAPDWGFYGENSIVGAGAPLAVGAALASKYDGSGRVAFCVFGDGAVNQGAMHESLNFAATFSLPVIFICENNGYAELTPISEVVRSDILYERCAGYGIPAERIDGNDPLAVAEAVRRALDLARGGGGPTFLEAITERLVGHYIGDAQQYRPKGEIEAARSREPLVRSRNRLIGSGLTADELAHLENEVEAEIEAALRQALSMPPADVATVREHVYA